MTKCVSPIPGEPIGVSAQTTCASIDVAGQVPETPSNCNCPDTILDFPVGNREHHYDRFWNVGVPPVRIQKNYIVALQVNKDGNEYDQIFVHSEGECYEGRLDRFEVQVLNRQGLRKIAAVRYDNQGVLQTTLFDVDMTPTFGDGQPHWVIVVASDQPGNNFGIKVYVDATEVGFGQDLQGDLSDFVKLRVVGNVEGASVPFAMWQYEQALEQCLTSGQYNGFGGCALLEQSKALRWDRNLTDLNIDTFNEDRIVVPFDGTPTRRNAYLIHPKLSGRVYWEVDRGDGAICRGTKFFFGGVRRGLVLNDNHPGQVAGSWGLGEEATRLWANGVLLASDFGQIQVRNMFCYDVQTRELWVGWEVAGTETRNWQGGGEPGAGAESRVLFATIEDVQLVHSFMDPPGSIYISSSAESCQYPAPSGFGYLT